MTSTLTHRPLSGAARRPLSPIHVWAAIGGTLLVLEIAALTRWVTGPNFQEIPVGADQPPEWMRIALDTTQIAVVAIAVVVAWRLLFRPLVRERRLTLNGTFVIAGFLAAPWDGLSAWPNQWFNYNSYLFNKGSVLSAVPGVVSPNSDGVGQAWPCFALGAYVILVPALGALGCLVMRNAKRRFPTMRAPGLIAICLVVIIVLETTLEAAFLAPLGAYSLAGGPWPIINGDHYYTIPFLEILHGGMFFTVPAVLKYYVNDHGETVAERGAQTIPGTKRQAAARAVAVIGAIHLGFLLTYHLPVMGWAMNSREYPDDVKQRSYFLGNACGESLNIACPGPDTPILRPGAGHFDWDGNFVPPAR